MLVILLNCVTLGMFQPCEDVECQSERCTILEVRISCCPACWDVQGAGGCSGSWDPHRVPFPQDPAVKALLWGVFSNKLPFGTHSLFPESCCCGPRSDPKADQFGLSPARSFLYTFNKGRGAQNWHPAPTGGVETS